jgi:hypothetical protein
MGCRAAAHPPNPKNGIKKTEFVDIMISKVSCDIPFCRNPPHKINKTKKNKEIRYRESRNTQLYT